MSYYGSLIGEPESNENWEKKQKKIKEAIKARLDGIKKGKTTEVLKAIKGEEKSEDNTERKANERLAEAVFHEALECYCKGEYTLKEFITELKDSLDLLFGESAK